MEKKKESEYDEESFGAAAKLELTIGIAICFFAALVQFGSASLISFRDNCDLYTGFLEMSDTFNLYKRVIPCVLFFFLCVKIVWAFKKKATENEEQQNARIESIIALMIMSIMIVIWNAVLPFVLKICSVGQIWFIQLFS